MKPPSHFGSAKVLYWAWSGDEPFGIMQYQNGKTAFEIYGFAICFLLGEIYRFSCDHNWAARNDSDFDSVQEAMDAIYEQYQNQAVPWNKFDDTDIDTLISESKSVKFYQEVGGRRIIQKVLEHLHKYNCEGMSVQSVGQNTWLLSVQKKDVQIASEIVKQNVHQ